MWTLGLWTLRNFVIGKVNIGELVNRKFFIRYMKSRVRFNTNAASWSTCMDKCLMYSEARAPSYNTQEELDDLIRWALVTSAEPATMEPYPTFPSWFFWVAYR